MSVHLGVSSGIRRRTVGWLAGVALIGLAQPVAAADVTLGLGPAVGPDYQGSDDYELVPAWQLVVSDLYHPATNVTVIGPRLRSNLVPHPQLRAGIAGLFIGERDDVSDKRVDNMRNTDTAVMLGAIVGWDFLPQPEVGLIAGVEAVYDVANDNGALVSPHIRYANVLPGSPWSVGTEFFTTWASDDFMTEQFAVSNADAGRSGLPRFRADEGFKDVGLRVGANYRFTDHWSTTLLGQYTRLLGDAADSPIVDDRGNENQLFFGLTLNYSFGGPAAHVSGAIPGH